MLANLFSKLVLTGLMMVFGSLAFSQTGGADGLSIERFKPASDSQGLVLSEAGQGETAWNFSLGLYFNFSKNPLVLKNQTGNVVAELVSDRLGASLVGSLGFTNWLALGLQVPFAIYQAGDNLDEQSGQSLGFSSSTMEDLRLIPKFTFLREEKIPISLGLAVPISIPTGNRSSYSGTKSITVSPTLAISAHGLSNRLFLAFNVGAWLQGGSSYRRLSVGHELFYRLGVGFEFVKNLIALGEVLGGARLATLFENAPRETPLEWFLGLRYLAPRDIRLTLGGALGCLSGWGTPNYRVFLSMIWAPTERDPK